MCAYAIVAKNGEEYDFMQRKLGVRPFKRAWLGGVLGDLRVIFIHAESAPSVARFRPHYNLVNSVNPVVGNTRVEITFE